MNRALELSAGELNISIGEFAVAGVPFGTFFGHEWYIGTDDEVDPAALASLIDKNLKILNDDYAVERSHALKNMAVNIFKESVFLEFLKSKGKTGGQHKFPRVLKGNLFEEWKSFLEKRK